MLNKINNFKLILNIWGCNKEAQKNLIDFCKNDDEFELILIDEITKKYEDEFFKLYNTMNYMDIDITKKDVFDEIKKNLENKLKNVKKKYVIVLGDIFFKFNDQYDLMFYINNIFNIKIYCEFDFDNKIKEDITHHITLKKNEIINGKFNLNLINYELQKNKYKTIFNFYKNINYIFVKSLSNIMYFLSNDMFWKSLYFVLKNTDVKITDVKITDQNFFYSNKKVIKSFDDIEILKKKYDTQNITIYKTKYTKKFVPFNNFFLCNDDIIINKIYNFNSN